MGKKFAIPHSQAILIAVMLLASILTYLIPAGSYERIVISGKTIVVNGSFSYIQQTPVNPLTILKYTWNGLDSARDIVFSLLLSGGGLGIILKTGMFQGAATTLSRRAAGKEWIVIVFLMTVFALLCIPININYFIPFAPLGIVIAKAMGYDALVGISIIMLGGAAGFICGAMNLAVTGTAQAIAELPIFSGMGFRLLSMIPFLASAIFYVLHYCSKIKNNPKKSYCYELSPSPENLTVTHLPEFERKHIPVAIVTAISIFYMVYVAIFSSLSMAEAAYIFMYMGLIGGIVYRMPMNTMCKEFINGVKDMTATGILIGFAYAISAILNAGHIMDTVVHTLSSLLETIPAIFQAPAMFFMQVIIDLFISSGAGQAAVTMPIFIPVADLLGIPRQVCVLAFNFGDGVCHFIIPHAAATMGFVAAANIPFTTYFKFILNLFAIWSLISCCLLIIATVIGYV